MKNIKIIVLIFSLLSLVLLFAENYMELIWEQQGEHIEAEYGYSIASIDFNGDNIDDLVVGSYKWSAEGTPSGPNHGKIYFYYGGDDFDNIPELTMDGGQYSYSTGLGKKIVNLGDVNGDGYEDLGSRRAGDFQTIRYYLEIYYGGPDCDTIPDFQHIIYNDNVEYINSLYPLGDVNSDGYNDVGFVIASSTPVYDNSFYIIYGAENPFVEYWAGFGNGGGTIREIGNINNDLYDDFMISFYDNEYSGYCNIIFYGDTVIDPVIIDTLYSNTANFIPGGAYAGDFNGDGTDDFIGCWGAGEETELWFGNVVLSEVSDVHLNAYSDGNKSIGVGDLNSDGFSDIVLGNPYWSNHQGKAYFFIGDTNANGSIDLDIPAPVIVGTQYGTSVAVGDFNNDGFDDAAIGAPSPYSGWYPGYVYVYAGNDSLEETTPVSVNEISSIPGITFNAFPNPFNPTVTFEIKAENYENLQIEIFNIKGQKVKTLNIGKTVWFADGQPSGVYFCKLINVEDSKVLSIKKVTLMK
ncbi:MAG: FG-GAP repeat protein [Candidatus Cloacimonetes bacterium]|nr:FG-GAP repeat protein [Candidatus Cloacimonadota bacterium]